MSNKRSQHRSNRSVERRRFLRYAGVATSTAVSVSLGSGIGAARSEPEKFFHATRADAAATAGTGGYKLHNTGQLHYLYSYQQPHSSDWRHLFSFEGFGFTTYKRHGVSHDSSNNERYYFGHPYDSNQRLGQYASVETSKNISFLPDLGAGSNGWFDPEDLWHTFKAAVRSANSDRYPSGYAPPGYGPDILSTADVAEELHDAPDTRLAERFFDGDIESLEGELEDLVRRRGGVGGGKEGLESFVTEALLAFGGIVISKLPHGTALEYGLTAAQLAYEAYSGVTDDPEQIETVQETESVSNDFDARIRFPNDRRYLTYDDDGLGLFDGVGVPMRGHHVAVEFGTPPARSGSWEVTFEQGFKTNFFNDRYPDETEWSSNTPNKNSFTWALDLPTGRANESPDDVCERVAEAMENVTVNAPRGDHDESVIRH